jgi:hypothetical protein
LSAKQIRGAPLFAARRRPPIAPDNTAESPREGRMAEQSELDRIDPQPLQCKLHTGLTLDIQRMRTRQFFRLLRVLTHGAGPALMQNSLDFKGEASEFAGKLLMLVVVSIPDAEQEAVAFLASMTRPAGLVEKQASQLTKAETEANAALWARFNEDMHNPEIEDTMDLVEAIVRQEAPELQALGKKLERMISLFRKTGQDKEPAEPELSPQDLSSAPSQQPSTPSATSTDGPTSTFSTSPSADYDRSSRPFEPAATGSTTPA